MIRQGLLLLGGASLGFMGAALFDVRALAGAVGALAVTVAQQGVRLHAIERRLR